ncbi:MAG: ATP-binding protein [Nitriliruptoraceae bacterium]
MARSLPMQAPARESGAHLRSRAWRIVGGYAVIASLWILFSDQALLALGTDPATLVRFSTYKGLAFVGVTALLLLVLIRRAFGQIADTYADLETSEREVRALNVTLEARVADRTDELRSALVRAEAADEIKSQFLATMSHELRTPLNSIIGFTGIILGGMTGPLTEEQSRQLGMVQASARHLLALINDVLDISKIEAGQLDVSVEPFDLVEIIDRAVQVIAPSAEAKGLVVTSEVADRAGSDVGGVHARDDHYLDDHALDGHVQDGRVAESMPSLRKMFGDPRRVEQILLNLLSNAVKFTEAGEIRLTAMSEPADTTSDPSGTNVRIDVHDTGIGIEPNEIEHLFAPFRQVDSGLARRHEGTGLGLAICQRLATLMGGKVTATSMRTVGSTFTVWIPMDARPPS